jgi:hypothetical protein
MIKSENKAKNFFVRAGGRATAPNLQKFEGPMCWSNSAALLGGGKPRW